MANPKTKWFFYKKALTFFFIFWGDLYFSIVFRQKLRIHSKWRFQFVKSGKYMSFFWKNQLRFFSFFEQNVISDFSDVRNFRLATFSQIILKIRSSKCDQMIKTVVFNIIFQLRNVIQPPEFGDTMYFGPGDLRA